MISRFQVAYKNLLRKKARTALTVGGLGYVRRSTRGGPYADGRVLVAAGDKAAATAAMQAASRELDVAASKGIIHKNQAANRKSGIAKLVDGIEG